MTHATPPGPVFDFEAFGAAVGLGLVCGGLSVIVPIFVAPTATLAALALAGWVSLVRRQGRLSRHGLDARTSLALGVLGSAGVGFFVAPGALASFRGLILAAGMLPLFVTERRRSSRRSPDFSLP